MSSVKAVFVLPARVILTAWGFLQFAGQVLWLGKWQMPRLIRKGGDAVAQRKKAIYTAHRHVDFYLQTLSALDLVKFHFEGTPSQQPCVLVANHPSLLDFIVFLKDFPNAVCLYKSQSLDNPVLSSFVQVAGYIEGMDGTSNASKRVIAACCERLQEGHHVAIFPEGTRSGSATDVRRFRTTGFHAAIRSRVAVQPVAIHCRPLFLGKNQRWAEFSRQTNHMTIRYLDPVLPGDLPVNRQTAAGLAEVARTQICAALASMEPASVTSG